MEKVFRKKIFNQSSQEEFMNAKILGGNPNGIINFNRTPHAWANDIYKKMQARTWFPEQVNISKDRINYPKLSVEDKRAYDLVLAQLIANDSIQTNQLMDGINQFITSPVVNACLSRQSQEESVHSESYSVMAEDICQDTDRIFSLHKTDDELRMKNAAVEYMYNKLYNIYQELENGQIIFCPPSKEDILLAMVANQILEELVFPGGFVVMLSFEKTMPGSAEMIKEILKDESLSHVELFKMIFRSAINESFNGVVPKKTEEIALQMIEDMCNAEKRWTKYVASGLLGFTEQSINNFVEGKANSVCRNLKLQLLYPNLKDNENPLNTLLVRAIKGGEMESRSNFFTVNPTEYSKNSLENDY